MKRLIIYFMITLNVFHQYAKAEYRVYQYLIFDQPNLNIEPRILLSSLPPRSLNSYYGSFPFLQTRLIRSWICPNHTGGNQDYCQSPYLSDGKNQTELNEVKP